MDLLQLVQLGLSEMKNTIPGCKISKKSNNLPTQRICIIIAIVYIYILHQGNNANASIRKSDSEETVNLTTFSTNSRDTWDNTPSHSMASSKNSNVSMLYGTSRLIFKVSNSTSLESVNLYHISETVVDTSPSQTMDTSERPGNEHESAVTKETSLLDFITGPKTLTSEQNRNEKYLKENCTTSLNIIKNNLTVSSESTIPIGTSYEIPSTSFQTALSNINKTSEFDLTTEENSVNNTSEMVTGASTSTITLLNKHESTELYFRASLQSTISMSEGELPSLLTSKPKERRNKTTYDADYLSSSYGPSMTTVDKRTSQTSTLRSTPDDSVLYKFLTTLNPTNTRNMLTNIMVNKSHLPYEVSNKLNVSEKYILSTTSVKQIPYSQSSSRPKQFFFRHINNLTDTQKSNTIIGIVFISQIDIVEWFHTYDDCFRNTIASLTSQMKGDKQTSNPLDIIYIAPTPTKNEKKFCISFVVQSPISNDLFELGEMVVSAIKKNISDFSKKLKLPVVMVKAGYDVTEKCNSRSSSNQSNWFVNCLAISIVIVAIGGIFGTCLQKVKHERSLQLQRESNIQVWGSHRRHRSQYVSTHPLRTTAQETNISSTSDTESPKLNGKTTNYKIGIENALIHYHENHDVTEDTKL